MIEERDREGAVGTIDVYDLDHSLAPRWSCVRTLHA